MKYIIYILLFIAFANSVNAQSNPSGFPTQFSTGWFRWGWPQADSGLIIGPRVPNFTPRFPGTTILYQHAGVDSNFNFWNGVRWIDLIPGFDSTSLSNRVNLKLNITDTTGKWLGKNTRLVDTVYRVNDSTVGYTIKGIPYTFQILGGSHGGGGGTGTVTSVGLSMPAAFTVSGSPITTNGTFNVSGAGTAAQYLKGNMTLGTTDTSMIPNFFSKVRSELSATSPLTYNSFTGAFAILNANEFGQKGAATFNNTDFFTDGNGTIFIRNIPGDWCNIVKYGADTTGLTDASPIVQSLVNSCKVVYIPHGTYLFASTVQMKDSVTVFGDGKSSIIKWSTSIPAFKLGFAAGGFGDKFMNLAFQGTAGTGGDGLQTAILLDSVSGVFVHNVSGFNLGGWLVRFRKNGYCCGTYTTTATRGNIISDCYAQGCYGGYSLDTLAEYNSVNNSTAQGGRYGAFVAGGNNRLNNNNFSRNTNGLVLTGGSNNGHGMADGNTINHCDTNIVCNGVTLGFTFSDNMVYASAFVQFNITGCDQIQFNGGDIVGTGSGIVNNSTRIKFNNVNMRTLPTWAVTNSTLSGFIIGKDSSNTITVLDFVNAKQLDITQTNGVATFSGSGVTKYRISDSLVLYGRRMEFGGENSGDSLLFSSTTDATKGKIWFGNTANRSTVAGSIGTQYRESADTWGIGVPIGSNPQTDIHVYRNYNGVADVRVEQISAGGGVGARFTAKNDVGSVSQFLQNSSNNTFFPDGLTISTSGAGGMGFGITGGGNYYFGGTTNTFKSPWSNVLLTITNVGSLLVKGNPSTNNGRSLQVNGETTENKDSVPIVTSITSQYLLLIDTAANGQHERITPSAAGLGNIYTTDGTLIANRTLSGANKNLTLDTLNNFRVNAFNKVFSWPDKTSPYTQSIQAGSKSLWFGYTPTAIVFSKGVGFVIDTNNNVSIGSSVISSSSPLYAAGGSTLATGLQVATSIFYNVASVSTSQSAGLDKHFYAIDASGGSVTITLPAASTAFGASMGIRYEFEREDASGNTVTIQRAGGDTINGATSFTLTAQYQTKQVQCTSTSTWRQF